MPKLIRISQITSSKFHKFISQTGEAEFNIIVKRKYTKAGLGDVPGSELSNNWWNRLYNTVAKNGTSDAPPEKSTSELLKDEMKKPLQFQKVCLIEQ